MKIASRSLGVAVALALIASACAGKKAAITEGLPAPWMAKVPSAPLAVEDVRVSSVDGHRAILLKLSRFPDSVTHEADGDPARLRLELAGPAVGDDLAEERIVPVDAVVDAVRVSRQGGTVRVVVDLHGDDEPDYEVHEMADWLMIRLAP